jgi:hypothetical protein
MLPGYTARTIHERNRRQLTTALVLLALVLGFFLYNWQYFSSFMSGPHDVSSAELVGFTKASDAKNVFVRIQAGATTDTGVVDTTTNDDHQTVTEAYYYVSDVGGKKLLVRGALAFPGTESLVPSEPFEGMLRPFNSHTTGIIQDQTRALESGTSIFLPFYLDTVHYRDFAYWSIVIGAILLVIAVWMLILYSINTSNPARHPYNKRLALYGPVDEMTQQIDAEMEGPRTTISQRALKVELTNHWLLANRLLQPIRVDRIVWVYRRVVKRKMYFVITVGKNYFVDVCDDLGNKCAVPLNEKNCAELFEALKPKASQAVFGYSKELEKLWNSLKTDRASFPGRVQVLPAQTLGEKTQNQMTR